MIQTLEEGMKDQSKRIKIPEKIRPFDVGYRIVNKHGQALALKNGASIFALPSLAEKAIKKKFSKDDPDFDIEKHFVEEVADFLGRTVSSVRCKSEIINKGKGQFTKRYWQDEEIRILRRYYQKVQDLNQLAKILNRSLDAVIIKANRLGLPRRKKKWDISKYDIETLGKMGMSCRQIACQLDRPLRLIRAVVYHYKIPVGKEEIQQHPWSFDNDMIFMRRT